MSVNSQQPAVVEASAARGASAYQVWAAQPANAGKTVSQFLAQLGQLQFPTLSALNAALGYDAGTGAQVQGDPVLGNNGVYAKVGASGAGSWTRVADLPSVGQAQIASTLTYPGSYSAGRASPSTTGSNIAVGTTWATLDAVGQAGVLDQLVIYAETAGSLTVKFFSKNTDGTYSWQTEFNVTVAAGANTFNSLGGLVPQANIAANWVIAFYSPSSGGAKISFVNDTVQRLASLGTGSVTAANVTPASTNAALVQYRLTLKQGPSLAARTSTNTDQATNPITALLGSAAPATTGSGVPQGHTRANAERFGAAGYLRSVTVAAETAGPITLKLFTRNFDGTYSWQQDIGSYTLAVGVNTFTSDNGDFPSTIAVDWNWVVGFYEPTTTGATVSFNTDSVGSSVELGSTNQQGANVGATAQSQRFVIGARIQGGPSVVSRLNQRATRGTAVTFEDQLFAGTAPPRFWNLSAGVTQNNGLTLTQSGSAASYAAAPAATFDRFTAATKKVNRCEVVATSAVSVFGMSFYPFRASDPSYGTLCVVDGAAGLLKMSYWDGISDPTAWRTLPIGFALVAGRRYVLEARRIRFTTIFTLTDTVTHAQVQLSADEYDGGAVRPGRSWGRASVILYSGAISVISYEQKALVSSSCAWAIYGDSNSEGQALGSAYAGLWSYALEDLRAKGDTYIAARGSDDSRGLCERLGLDLEAIFPKYAVVMMGTNDGNLGSWRANMQQFLGRCALVGSEPVLCTILPQGGSPALQAQQNADIKGGYFGRYRVIDMAAAVSLNHDGVTIDPTLYTAAQTLHANAAGQALMFAQAKADAPFLLD